MYKINLFISVQVCVCVLYSPVLKVEAAFYAFNKRFAVCDTRYIYK